MLVLSGEALKSQRLRQYNERCFFKASLQWIACGGAKTFSLIFWIPAFLFRGNIPPPLLPRFPFEKTLLRSQRRPLEVARV